MGIKSLSLTLSIFVWTSQIPLTLAGPLAPVKRSEPISKEALERILDEGGFPELKSACIDAVNFSLDRRIKVLQKRLLAIPKEVQSLKLVLENAEALMACKAPGGARKVLSRFGPEGHMQRTKWLLMSWGASKASMDHAGASMALRRLVNGEIKALDREELIVDHEEGGSPVTVSALDALAEHERYMGRLESAASVLLSGEKEGLVKARRLSLAAELVAGLSSEKYEKFLDLAFQLAQKEKAWGLALEILQRRLKLDLASGVDPATTKNRLEQLSKRLDDRYTLLEIVEEQQLQPFQRDGELLPSSR